MQHSALGNRRYVRGQINKTPLIQLSAGNRKAVLMRETAATSPFEKTELLPIGAGYERKGSLSGLLLPNGEILLNYDHNTKNSTLAEIAKVLQAKVVVVQGTWTFTPDTKEDD